MPGEAHGEVLAGQDPMGALKRDMALAVAMAQAFQDDSVAGMLDHLMRHVIEVDRALQLAYAELLAVAARADGELIIAESELHAISGLRLVHRPIPGAYQIQALSPEEPTPNA